MTNETKSTTKLNDTMVIVKLKAFDASVLRGSRGERAKLVKSGMTVANLKAAIEKAGVSGTATGLLRGVLIPTRMVSVK